MSDDESSTDEPIERPLCYHCGEPYSQGDFARHTEPVNCTVCYRCRGKPACYVCGHMYCSCEVHQF